MEIPSPDLDTGADEVMQIRIKLPTNATFSKNFRFLREGK
jgi:hypothetical protein